MSDFDFTVYIVVFDRPDEDWEIVQNGLTTLVVGNVAGALGLKFDAIEFVGLIAVTYLFVHSSTPQADVAFWRN